MAGNTGKMTANALAARGPRMALARMRDGSLKIFNNEYEVPHIGARVIARSFTKSYLEKIKKTYETLA